MTNVPTDLTNVASVSEGWIAILRDGRVRAWGNSTNLPASATNVTAVSGSGVNWCALRRDGSVINYQGIVRVHASNSVALAATSYGPYALKRDGAVIAVNGGATAVATNVVAIAGGGYDRPRVLFANGTVSYVPSVTNNNIVAIADPPSPSSYFVALQNDGTVVTGSGPARPSGLSNVVAVAAGSQHGLALKSDGLVVAWGNNNSGQTNVPAGLDNVVAIAAGESHSLALTADGTVVAWGNNSKGQTNVPAALTQVAAIFAGPYYSGAIVGDSPPTLLSQLPDESIWSGSPATFTVEAIGSPPLRFQWQFNGEIIDGATNSFYRIDSAAPAHSGIYNVIVQNARGTAASREAFLLVKTNINIAISGQPTSRVTWFGSSLTLRFSVEGPGPLNFQWYFNGSPISGATNALLPVANVGLEQAGDYWATVSYPYGVSTSSVARISVIAVAAWGETYYGATRVPTNLQSAAAISAGGFHNLFLKPNGTVTTSGYNNYGTTDVPEGLSNVVAVSGGYYHSLALRANGTVVGWGTNQYGQISIPPGLTNVVAIAAGAVHSLALRGDGTVVVWGDSRYYQTFVPPDLTNVVSIATRQYNSLALRADGTIEGWGWPDLRLDFLHGLSNVVGIAAGSGHWLALRNDGTVVTWGSDYYGQQRTFPRNLSNVVAIAAGDEHSLALRSDGTIVAWGSNVYGQTNVPSGLSNVVAITAGRYHSFALVAAGLVAPHVQTSSPILSNETFSTQVPTVRGKTYYLQHRDSLNSPRWMMHPPVPGDGNMLILLDPAANVQQRFYRVWQKP